MFLVRSNQIILPKSTISLKYGHFWIPENEVSAVIHNVLMGDLE